LKITLWRKFTLWRREEQYPPWVFVLQQRLCDDRREF
jgi:hypothetical protein